MAKNNLDDRPSRSHLYRVGSYCKADKTLDGCLLIQKNMIEVKCDLNAIWMRYWIEAEESFEDIVRDFFSLKFVSNEKKLCSILMISFFYCIS